MSAPSDGARADARKRLAESIGRLEGRGNWYTDAELAGVIADAKAEAWDEGYNACHEHIRDGLWGNLRPIPDSPYRSESGR